MPILSPVRKQVPLLKGLSLLHRGKVRDSYALTDDLMLVYATDAVSIFDFVLNALIPDKGMILTAMTHFWLTRLQADLGIKTHLVASGSDIDNYLPRHLQGKPGLQSRAMVVRRLQMVPVEFVAMGFLTGSGLQSYKETGMICGHYLPSGLQDNDELPKNIDTPTTKADTGHDLALDAGKIRKIYPQETNLLLTIYQYILTIAKEKGGIILADTKLEFGHDTNGKVILADEVGTPDSSRYWDAQDWSSSREMVRRKAPQPQDKQLIREWGYKQGVQGRDPLSLQDVSAVHQLEVPLELIMQVRQVYRKIFLRLTGFMLETYQAKSLGIGLSTFH